MLFIEELKGIRQVVVGDLFNCVLCSVRLMKQIKNYGVFMVSCELLKSWRRRGGLSSAHCERSIEERL